MNRLLVRDSEDFELKFIEARRFLRSAHLRHEAYCLLAKKPSLNDWQEKRLSELLEVPACKVQWFEEIVSNYRDK
jgi:hypothetical protein